MGVVVKEEHRSPLRVVEANRAGAGCGHLVAAVGGDCATVLDNRALGTSRGVVAQFRNEGRALSACAWVSADGVSAHPHGDAYLALASGACLQVVSLVAAAGQHPLAMGMGVGLCAMIPAIRRSIGGRVLKTALIIAVVACIPRGLRLGSIALCGESVLACLRQVAQSNITEPEPWSQLMMLALHDRWMVDLDSVRSR